MKFNWKLDQYQNLRAWAEYRSNIPRTQYEALSDVEKASMLALNEFLRDIENNYSVVLTSKLNELNARVADPSDWLTEFNLEYAVSFYLRDDDSEYEEDDDNILMKIEEIYSDSKKGAEDWGFGATHVDHAEPREYFSGEHHCYLYHQLYDHCHLDWHDLFRIGSIYIDIKIEEQTCLRTPVLLR